MAVLYHQNLGFCEFGTRILKLESLEKISCDLHGKFLHFKSLMLQEIDKAP